MVNLIKRIETKKFSAKSDMFCRHVVLNDTEVNVLYNLLNPLFLPVRDVYVVNCKTEVFALVLHHHALTYGNGVSNPHTDLLGTSAPRNM